MQLLLCYIFYLCAIFMSCRHSIAGVSKVAFIINGPTWACKLVLPLCCQQPSSCIRYIWYVAFNYYSWCFSLWCCHLMSLFMNNLMSSWVGKLINTWSTASPSVLWTVSLSLLSWKPLYLYWWDADECLRYLETCQNSQQAICQPRTKMNMRTDLQHTWVNDHDGCAISARRSGDQLPRLLKA